MTDYTETDSEGDLPDGERQGRRQPGAAAPVPRPGWRAADGDDGGHRLARADAGQHHAGVRQAG